MSYNILVPIATGSEEIEAITIIDVMVRAGYHVVIASADPTEQLVVKASRGVMLTAEVLLHQVTEQSFDAIILPGGLTGAENFRDNPLLIEQLKQQKQAGRLVAAICAAPALVLQHHHLFPDAQLTCHPNFQQQIPEAQRSAQRVVYDSSANLLTSQGPGTALEFSLAVVRLLSGEQHMRQVAEPMVPPAGITPAQPLNES
ncbi:DJ-1/PfpI family protein [Vibrio ruber]|uniref:Chaperone protein YajL n=1 Tax=Vibrio ruber (strain DSM 16370 / JCM 11486 / BCRC 17186 / CECT 7878 / LMG 23124 / VR1) TaxID=1123498 RepID=A0A1R4LI51_VIBR1|nr:DJ-1 family glyoxalase III [Vibrio ruber]WNJ94485.1 DJ-1/PfpI family protein [Vibrio ruber]SJN56133.1 Chaperone protein YajL [Vibrio ruber DSM 16370]